MSKVNTGNKERSGIIIGAAFLILVLAVFSPLHVVNAQVKVGDLFNKVLKSKGTASKTDSTCRGLLCRRADISPVDININSDSLRGDSVVITLEFKNRSPDTVVALLKIYDIVPPQFVPLDEDSLKRKVEKKSGSLLAEEDTSGVAYLPLGGWIIGLPDSVSVLPHSVRKIQVVLRKPVGATEGLYMGWIGAMSSVLMPPKPPQEKPVKLGLITKTRIIYDTRSNID